jgi:putative oxidoreductase
MWAILSRNRDAGIFALRLALGTVFIWLHGWPKLAGGMDDWKKYGEAMGLLHIHFWPSFWGFMATMAETLGALLVIVGLFFRPACLLLTFTMIVAAVFSYHNPVKALGALGTASHAIELAIVFFTLIFIGPGRYSVDRD